MSGFDTLGWQAALFAERLNRLDLLRLGARKPDGGLKLHVLRNHAFETVASALPPFLNFAGIRLSATLSDYDDSLSLPDAKAGAALVWMDFARLSRLDDQALADWAVHRLAQVRARAGGPLIVANSPDAGPRAAGLNAALSSWAAQTADVRLLRLDGIAHELGDAAFDTARAEATGTRLSDQAALHTARCLAFEVLPEALGTPVKAIAVDLDNTLYEGVLGEDGPERLTLTPGHAELQRELAAWAARGVLIAVISRNEVSDVEKLFAQRKDFPLRPDAVASWQVGWGDKSASVARAATAFNVAPDSFLFIDDNAGELIEAGRAHPGLRLLYARTEAQLTASALRLYPGLPRQGDFSGRTTDVRANTERAALANSAENEEAYLWALQPVLDFRLDPGDDRARLAEISRKTNQFNLALRRFDEGEVQRFIEDKEAAVVHVRLADRLADSGSVAGVFVRKAADGMAVVEELCISCRALGRRLEDIIVGEAVRCAAKALGTETIGFAYSQGARNAPALDWLRAKLGGDLPADAGLAPLSMAALTRAWSPAVRLTWTL